MQCNILWQDQYALAVNKPNNMLVHHSVYAGREGEESMLQQLKNMGVPRVYPLHRLDRKTSGLVLLAKLREDVPAFQKLFDEQKIRKTYRALLRGHVDAEGIVDTPVRNDRGNYRDALTHYRCIEHYELNVAVEPFETSRYSLVEMEPKTGRLHQLRVHANKISHPIIGDHKHGNRHHNRLFAEQFLLPDLFLHASELHFTHPFTNEEIHIHAPLPAFWARFDEIRKELSV